jgi:Spy/CpxP family protein refolding chaperone
MKSVHWFFLAASLLACAPAVAAPPPAPPPPAFPPPNASPHEARLQHIRSRVLRDKVGLSDDKAVKVEVILEKYAPERRRFAQKLREGRQKLRALMTLNSEDQTAYRGALDQIRTNRKALQDLMERAFGEISKELTPKEQARLFLALDDLKGKGRRHGRGRGHPHDDDRDDEG